MPSMHWKKFFVHSAALAPRALRHALCRAMVRIPEFPSGVTFEIASTQTDLDNAFRLVHDVYLKAGFTAACPAGRRISPYHALPSTTTLVAKIRGAVIATVSIIRDGRLGLPIDDLIDLSPLRNPESRMGEISALAIHPDFRGRSGSVLFYLLKYLYRYSRNYFGIDRFVIAVHPRRMLFYEALLMFKPLTSKVVEAYAFANNAPAACATLNLMKAPERTRRIFKHKKDNKNIYRFFFANIITSVENRGMKFPRRSSAIISNPVMTPEMLDFFFGDRTHIFETLSDRQMIAVKHAYPWPQYQSVLDRYGPCAHTVEMRRSPRYDTHLAGVVQYRNHDRLGEAEILDISRAGIKIYCRQNPFSGSVCRVTVRIADQPSITMKVRRRRSDRGVMGLELLTNKTRWYRIIEKIEEKILPDRIAAPAMTSHPYNRMGVTAYV